MAKYFILLVLIGITHFSFSTTITSANFSGTRNWSAANAWVGNQVPGIGDDVLYTGTGNIQIPNNYNTASLNNITIGPGKNLNILGNGGLFYTGTLTINGGGLNSNVSGTIIGGALVLTANNNASLSLSNSSSSTFTTVTNNGFINVAASALLTVTTFDNESSTSLAAGTTLTMLGDVINGNGANFLTAGSVFMDGPALQTIYGTLDFFNLTVASGSFVTLDGAAVVGLSGVLTLNGTATFDADGPGSAVFMIYSTGDTPTFDGSIATLPTPGNLTGQIYVQRWMSVAGPSSGRIYRYISSPVQNASVEQIQATVPVTGAFTGSSTCTNCITNQSMFSYDETVTGAQGLGFINFPSASNTETLTSGRGYAIYVRGNIDPILGNGAATWAVHGDINKGTINFPITYTNTGSPADDGWNLVGNPYPSAIDWAASSGWAGSNIGSTIYYMDNVNGVIATYNKLTTFGTNGGSQYIATGQAFYVQASGAASLSSDERVKAAGQETTFFRTKSLDNLMRIELVQGTKKDETIVFFSKTTTDALNAGYDAFKLKNPEGFNLSSLSSDNYNMVTNSMGPLVADQSKSVALNVSDAATGSYELRFNNLESFADVSIKLVDKFTGSETDLRTTSTYAFSVDSSKPDSFGAARFKVVLGQSVVTAVEPGSEFDIAVYPNPTKSKFSIKVAGVTKPYVALQNSLGQFIDEVTLTKKANSFEGTFDLSSQAAGIYFVRIVELENGKVNIKKILKN